MLGACILRVSARGARWQLPCHQTCLSRLAQREWAVVLSHGRQPGNSSPGPGARPDNKSGQAAWAQPCAYSSSLNIAWLVISESSPCNSRRSTTTAMTVLASSRPSFRCNKPWLASQWRGAARGPGILVMLNLGVMPWRAARAPKQVKAQQQGDVDDVVDCGGACFLRCSISTTVLDMLLSLLGAVVEAGPQLVPLAGSPGVVILCQCTVQASTSAAALSCDYAAECTCMVAPGSTSVHFCLAPVHRSVWNQELIQNQKASSMCTAGLLRKCAGSPYATIYRSSSHESQAGVGTYARSCSGARLRASHGRTRLCAQPFTGQQRYQAVVPTTFCCRSFSVSASAGTTFKASTAAHRDSRQ